MKLIITGGFLGSGKTTAIQQACGLLLSEGRRVAVITNDQGEVFIDGQRIGGSEELAAYLEGVDAA